MTTPTLTLLRLTIFEYVFQNIFCFFTACFFYCMPGLVNWPQGHTFRKYLHKINLFCSIVFDCFFKIQVKVIPKKSSKKISCRGLLKLYELQRCTLLEKKWNVAGNRDNTQFVHETKRIRSWFSDFRVVQYHELIRVVSRIHRYISLIF